MKTVTVVQFSLIILLMNGCVQSHQAIMAKEIKYSVDIEGVAESALIDGVPEGVNITNINNVLLRKIGANLVSHGLKNGSQDIIVAKYEIEYFGHKFRPPKARYIIKYHLELRNKIKDNVVFSQKLEASDSDLDDLTDEISNDIVQQIMKIVK